MDSGSSVDGEKAIRLEGQEEGKKLMEEERGDEPPTKARRVGIRGEAANSESSGAKDVGMQQCSESEAEQAAGSQGESFGENESRSSESDTATLSPAKRRRTFQEVTPNELEDLLDLEEAGEAVRWPAGWCTSSARAASRQHGKR